MAKTKQQKQEILKDLEKGLSEAKSVVFSTFSKLDIKAQEALRRKLRETGSTFQVFKKTLVQRALAARGIVQDGVEQWFGNIGIAQSGEDDVAPAQTLISALKEKEMEGLQVHLGLFHGKVLSQEEVKSLAALPRKDQLIAQLVGTFAAPLSSFLRVLQGNQRNLVSVLNQIKDKN